MAGSWRSWAFVGGLAVAAGVQPLACGDEPGPGSPVADDTLAALLEDVGPEVVHPALARALLAAEALRDACDAWAADGGDADAEQAAAQEAWRSLMAAWQEVEVYQVGPAASSLTAIAGEDTRDEVYSWPTVNRCRVDQETVYASWDDADFFETSLVNVYGLDALEVLLFSPSGENDCPSQVDINAGGSWDALGESGVQRNRAAYALAVAEYALDVIAGLERTWGEEDFGAKLAGSADSPYESQSAALNAVFDGLFYVELVTKDRKLAWPLGIGDCTDCADQGESLLAGGSQQWVAINLAAFRTLYTGGDRTGMDDLLRSLGRDETAEALLAALDQADAATAAVGAPLDQADDTDLQAAYDAVKAVTDLLKGDVATYLALQVPSEAAGDND